MIVNYQQSDKQNNQLMSRNSMNQDDHSGPSAEENLHNELIFN